VAISLQRKLELAGALSKVQPELQRLHLLPEPKKRHRLRNAVLVGSAIAAGAAVAVVLLRRRGGHDEAMAWNGGEASDGSPTQDAPETEADSGEPAIDADGQHEDGADGDTWKP
jgi:hypothetical protein